MLLGDLQKDDFLQSPYNLWFTENYHSYEIDKQALSDINLLQEDLTVIAFLGSWCGDTKRELPRFLKILEYLSFPEGNIRLIGLDRAKQAPVYLENIWNIEYVPTFIILKNGIEIGRIIEQPLITLEEDLKQIVGLKYVEKTGQKVLRTIRKADTAPYFGQCEPGIGQEGIAKCSKENVYSFFKTNLSGTSSDGSLKGKASVKFIIDVDGLVKNIRVTHADTKASEAEAFRLVNRMNHAGSAWKPAKMAGQPIPVNHKVYISFSK